MKKLYSVVLNDQDKVFYYIARSFAEVITFLDSEVRRNKNNIDYISIRIDVVGKTLEICMEDDNGVYYEKTAESWCHSNPVGYLACADL